MASVCPDELSLSPVTSWLSVSGDERKSGPAFSVTHGGCGCVGNDRLPPPPPLLFAARPLFRSPLLTTF